MKTRCPKCHTIFRITQEQIGAHAGKVRCGQCRAVFNALDDLIGERFPTAAGPEPEPMFVDDSPQTITEFVSPPQAFSPKKQAPASPPDSRLGDDPGEDIEFDRFEPRVGFVTEDIRIEPAAPEEGKSADSPDEAEAPDPETGYDEWLAGSFLAETSAGGSGRPRWPFRLAAAVLTALLAGQSLFHFRGELAISMPGLRPTLETLSLALGDPLPLPRHADFVSIEASDLQADPARGNLLMLNATLRNKARYGQAWPSLELSLTDTQDTVIARRIFTPQDYLPAKNAVDSVFSGNSDFAVRLWIETVDLGAAGYRLFVFYPETAVSSNS
ncbi:MAG: zinc-ribbon domain-containing protein [Candidatus Accumulibacter sp.]|nr:zinc-ribbon domain-containing protein [Accumulibacter sp.]